MATDTTSNDSYIPEFPDGGPNETVETASPNYAVFGNSK
jgi:hypothetical protein